MRLTPALVMSAQAFASEPWAAGPALGVGFPLVLMGILTLFIVGASTPVVFAAGGAVFVGLLLFFHPR